ncbi:uroporphyrinogen-III synthase [Pelagibacteraceae bacterium]|jgi:uroporphyrinogen-III synthase|nr:uroporphyrinogen-III synthase [Pelagibacteraceae bacterium]|tara:strand:- start:370 stop:1068 length:699 start_codon:yes stop_codon:yes gene_type:complete
MNILITRPLIDAEDMMEKFFALGHKIIHLPTLKILPLAIDPINPDEFDAFIFTSANAIRKLKLNSNNKNLHCFCVGSLTEKIVRQAGFNNTSSAGGTVNALKNLIMISEKINKNSKLAYFCGDNISYNLDSELKKEGIKVKKIVNYSSEQIQDLNSENKKLIELYPPDLIFIYSSRSAQSFVAIVKNYSLGPLMTQSTVMCISEKVAYFFKSQGWEKVEIFSPGDEMIKLEG